MAVITANTTFGEGGITFAGDTRIFIVDQAGSAPLAASGTSFVSIDELTINDSAAVTVNGSNFTLVTSNLLNDGDITPTELVNVNFPDTHVQMTTATLGQFKVNLNAPDAIFQYTGGTTTAGWGAWGPAGTASATWRIPGAQFWGQDGWYITINALDNNSDLTGVRFVSTDGDFGVYSELPFFDFTGIAHGNFTRSLNGRDTLWAITGGPDRENRTVGIDWSLMAQNDLSVIDTTADRYIMADGRVHVFLVNQYRPAGTGDLIGALRQLSGGSNPADTAQLTVAQGWNPVFVDPVGNVLSDWRVFGQASGVAGTDFQLRALPNQKDTRVGEGFIPSQSLSAGAVYSTTNQNGFLVVNQVISAASTTDSTIIEPFANKTLRIYDFKTQVGNEIGMDIDLAFPSDGLNRERAIAVGSPVNVQEITTSAVGATTPNMVDLGWAQEDRRVFALDENIPTRLTEALAAASNAATNSESVIFENWYGLVKQLYNFTDGRDTTAWPLGNSVGNILDVDRNLMFEATPDQAGVSDTIVSLRHGTQVFNAITATSLKNTLRMSGANNTVTWGQRTFPSGITLAGGIHNTATTTGTFMQNVNWSFDGNVQIHFTGLPAGEYNVNDLLGTVTQPAGSNQLRISAANAGVILFTTDVNYFNDWVAWPEGGGSNVELQTRAAPKRYLLSTGSLAGRVAVRNISTNQSLLPNGVTSMPVIAGEPFEITIDVNTSGINDGDQVRLFYKPNNTLTTGYQLVTESMNINDLGSGDVIIHTPAVGISPELFIDSTEATVPTGVTATCAGVVNGRVNFDIDGATTAPSGQETQRLLLGAVDNDNYFNAHVTLEALEDFVQAGFNSTIAQSGTVRLASTDNVTQQFLTAVGPPAGVEIENLNVSGANIPGVILFSNPEGVSVGEIVAAVDASTTGTTVQAIQTTTMDTQAVAETNRRAAGYLVGNGSISDANGSRLNGIRPKQSDYVPGTTYEDIL